MTRRSNTSRPLCSGDRARFSVSSLDRSSIYRRASKWSTPFLMAFLPICHDENWRKVVAEIIQARMISSSMKTSGHRVTKPVIT
jgi:hypothetical protein